MLKLTGSNREIQNQESQNQESHNKKVNDEKVKTEEVKIQNWEIQGRYFKLENIEIRKLFSKQKVILYVQETVK